MLASLTELLFGLRFARVLAQQEQTLTLAPAAGAGIGKILADALLADPEFVPLMIGALKGGLSATRSFWAGKGDGGHLVSEPDSRIQIQAAALLLAHMEGEPVKRIIHQHLGGDGAKTDVTAALRESPALQEAVERALANAKFRTRNVKKPAEQVAQLDE